MSLRKFSNQSYFNNLQYKSEEQQEKIAQSSRKDSLSPALHVERMKTLLSEKQVQESPSPKRKKIRSEHLTATSHLLTKFKNKPKYDTVSRFKTEEPEPIKKCSAQQEETIRRLNAWEKKKKQNIEKQAKLQIFKEVSSLLEKPKINEDSHKLAEKARSKIPNREQSSQWNFSDYQPLQKLSKYRKAIIIEKGYLFESEFLTKEIQTDESYLKNLPKTMDEFVDVQISTKIINHTNYYVPIYERTKYHQQQKEQKLQEQRQSQTIIKIEPKFEQEKFDQFLKDQDEFLKKKQEFLSQQQQEKLENAAKVEAELKFQPKINKVTVKQKFNERLQNYESKKTQKLQIQAELLKPGFQPSINNKSRRVKKIQFQIAEQYYSTCQSYGSRDGFDSYR